jgi:hypothetical protein
MDRRFQHLVAAGANTGDRGPHDNVWDDAYSLRGFVIRMKHAISRSWIDRRWGITLTANPLQPVKMHFNVDYRTVG